MLHDASKVVLGSSQSSVKEIDNRAGVIAAGLAVRLKSDGTLSVASADGSLLGISMGVSQSQTDRTAIARKGLRIPIKLTASFTPVIGAQVNISDTTGKAGAAGAGFTAVNAVYSSANLTGIEEDGSTFADGVAFIDFPGGV